MAPLVAVYLLTWAPRGPLNFKSQLRFFFLPFLLIISFLALVFIFFFWYEGNMNHGTWANPVLIKAAWLTLQLSQSDYFLQLGTRRKNFIYLSMGKS